jgi:hypothetical protein
VSNPEEGGASRVPSGREVTRPFGVVVASAVDGFRTLLRKHVELAKIEATEAIAVRAKGVGMMLGAGVLGIYAVGFLAAAIVAALALILPAWAANLIVALLMVAAAAALVMVGRRSMQTAPTAEQTRKTLEEDARWAKQQIAR